MAFGFPKLRISRRRDTAAAESSSRAQSPGSLRSRAEPTEPAVRSAPTGDAARGASNAAEPAPEPPLPSSFQADVWKKLTPTGTSTQDMLFPEKDAMRHLRRAIGRQPALAQQLERAATTLPDADENARRDPKNPGAVPRHVPEMRVDAVRTTWVEEATEQLRAQSAVVEAYLRDNPNCVYDFVIIGAGIHGTSAAYAAQGSKVLCVDQGDRISANFGETGDMFYLNSANRAENLKRPQPGEGNINPGVGPIKVPDVSGLRWPAAKTIAEVATLNFVESGAHPLFNKTLAGIEPQPFGRPYKVRLSASRPGQESSDELTVNARKVVLATGIGLPIIPVPANKGGKLIEEELATFEAADLSKFSSPGIMTAEQALRLASAQLNPRDPYYRGKVESIAVVGSGDSANTFLELLGGIGPEQAYMSESSISCAQQGTVAPIKWIVGEKGIKDCKEYVERTRSRYSQLSSLLQKPENLEPIQGRLTAVARAGNRFVLTYAAGRSEQRLTVDRVILATGYQLRGLGAQRDGDTPLAVVRVPRAGVGLEPVGKKILGNDIFLVGPAAGPDIVEDDRVVRRIPQNKVALFKTIPKTEALIKQEAAELAPKLPFFTDPRPEIDMELPPLRLDFRTDARKRDFELSPAPVEAKLPSMVEPLLWAHLTQVLGGCEVAIEGRELSATLAGQDGASDPRLALFPKAKVKIAFRQGEDGRLIMTSKQLTDAGLAAVATRLKGNAHRFGLLAAFVAHLPEKLKLSDEGERLTERKLKVSFPVRSGKIAPNDMTHQW